MIRRPPTRIEMKLEDIHEYEKVKREADAARRAASKAAAAATTPAAGGSSSSAEGAAAAKTKREIIQERIGFVQLGSKHDPTPKPST